MLKKTSKTQIFFFLCFLIVTFTLYGDANQFRVMVINLRGTVDRHQSVYLGRALETARANKTELIIIEIDTFGGRVDTALEIAAKIGSSNFTKIVAYIPINSEGYGISWSAGALMAFSCPEIWMAAGTSMGAAAPVYQTSEGMKAAEEKTVSAVRGQIAALAEKNGYPMSVAMGMVDADLELFEVNIDGQTSVMTSGEIAVLKGQNADFEIGKTISEKGKLLTLTAGEMQRYGISKGTVQTREEIAIAYGYSADDIVIYEKTRADEFLAFLTSGAVTSLLMIAALVLLYLEITSPGFGIPGTLALICFAIIFGASGLMGTLESFEILMFVAGLILLLLEFFIIPGFGVAGILGTLLVLSSLVLNRQDFVWPKFNWQWNILRDNIAIVGISIVGSIAVIAGIMLILPRSSIFEPLILKESDNSRRIFGKKKNDADNRSPDLEKLVVPIGQRAVAVTNLRPVGKICLDNKDKNVIVAETDGIFVTKGTPVQVTSVDGIKVMVITMEE